MHAYMQRHALGDQHTCSQHTLGYWAPPHARMPLCNLQDKQSSGGSSESRRQGFGSVTTAGTNSGSGLPHTVPAAADAAHELLRLRKEQEEFELELLMLEQVQRPPGLTPDSTAPLEDAAGDRAGGNAIAGSVAEGLAQRPGHPQDQPLAPQRSLRMPPPLILPGAAAETRTDPPAQEPRHHRQEQPQPPSDPRGAATAATRQHCQPPPAAAPSGLQPGASQTQDSIAADTSPPVLLSPRPQPPGGCPGTARLSYAHDASSRRMPSVSHSVCYHAAHPCTSRTAHVPGRRIFRLAG
jgi:hypothetical protein